MVRETLWVRGDLARFFEVSSGIKQAGSERVLELIRLLSPRAGGRVI